MRGIARSFVPGTFATSKRFATPTSIWQLLPGGHQAKGMNIWVRQFNEYGGTPFPTTLADFWRDWEWSAAGAFGAAGNWIRPQIDLAISLGCNYIRFFNTIVGRNAGSGYASILSDQKWLGQWQQVLDYCRAQGIYCYPTLELDSDASSALTYWNFSPNNAWRVPEFQHLFRLFQAYQDVVMAVDLMNEGYGWATNTSDTSFNNPGGNVFNAVIVYNALKPLLPNTPITISTYFKAAPNQANPFTANGGGQRLPVQNVLDFYDAHCYYNAAPGDYDIIMSFTGKPMLIGEFGEVVQGGNRPARYTAVLNLANQVTAGRQAAGAAPWSMADYWTADSDRYGVADVSGNVRSDVSGIFASFPS